MELLWLEYLTTVEILVLSTDFSMDPYIIVAIMIKSPGLRQNCLGLNPGSAMYHLDDLGKII